MQNKLLKNISLDFGRDTLPITIFAKQYDKESRIVNITPLNCGQSYELESGITARLQLTKPDGHTVLNDAVIKDNIISIELTEQVLLKDGTATAEIGLYKGAALLSSQIFYINISKSAYNPDAPASTSEYNALTKALENVSNTVNDAKSAADNAIAAATSAEAAKNSADNAATAASSAADSAAEAAAIANNAAETATQAASVANEAAQAAAGADNLNITAEQTETGATISVTDRTGTTTELHLDTLMSINSWQDVRNAVRLGLGAKLFPVGYEFTTLDSNTGVMLEWAVRAHDHHKPANKHLTHSMTLELKRLYSNADGSYVRMEFDAAEAFACAWDEIAPGTYNFTVEGSYYAADNGKTFQFTLTQAVPVGGQIWLNVAYNKSVTTGTIETYTDAKAIEYIEEAVITEGNEGTSLGTTDGYDLNHPHRYTRGSNNYAQSAIRQWLNSKESAGNVWQQATYFDVAPSWIDELNGFMHGLPEEFLEVVVPAIIPCRTNSVCEIESLDGTQFNTDELYELEDNYFILSRGEIYGTYDNDELQDGTLLDYYDGLTNAEIKKFDNSGVARSAWLRTPFPTNAYNERVVSSSTGYIHSTNASNTYGVAPACIIG